MASPSHEKDPHKAHHENHSSHIKRHQPWITKAHHHHHHSSSTQDQSFQAKDAYFRHLYERPPDFEELARLDPEFASVVKGRRELDFNDAGAVMQLTKTLLRLDFGLEVELPHDRLCPPVANRHNYISWLKDLLDTTSYDHPRGRKIVGLDIGTGASCIYPLLGCTERAWSFIATDIDEKSLGYARSNVQLNHLEARINVVPRQPSDMLIPLDDMNMASLDFAMTNPPFYESEDAMLQSAAEKSRPAFTACTGSQVEMVTPGGEVGFVAGRIVEESLVLRSRVQWYTAMLGFLSSVAHVIDRLKRHGVDNYAVTELVQGSRTRRWAVAWSFGPMRPAQDVARGAKATTLRGLLPPVSEFVVVRIRLGADTVGAGAFAERLSGAVAALELMSWRWEREKMEGIGRAADKVWARAWRRRKKRKEEEEEGEKEEEVRAPMSDEGRCVFGFKVMVRVTMQDVAVECRWMEGHDASALESFRGFLKSAAERSAMK